MRISSLLLILSLITSASTAGAMTQTTEPMELSGIQRPFLAKVDSGDGYFSFIYCTDQWCYYLGDKEVYSHQDIEDKIDWLESRSDGASLQKRWVRTFMTITLAFYIDVKSFSLVNKWYAFKEKWRQFSWRQSAREFGQKSKWGKVKVFLRGGKYAVVASWQGMAITLVGWAAYKGFLAQKSMLDMVYKVTNDNSLNKGISLLEEAENIGLFQPVDESDEALSDFEYYIEVLDLFLTESGSS